jgi:hypothetical protein
MIVASRLAGRKSISGGTAGTHASDVKRTVTASAARLIVLTPHRE